MSRKVKARKLAPAKTRLMLRTETMRWAGERAKTVIRRAVGRRLRIGTALFAALVLTQACDDGDSCPCAEELLPEGFYRYTRRSETGTHEEILQLVRAVGTEGEKLVFGFGYRLSYYSVSPINGSLEDGCHFTATDHADLITTTYDGRFDCEENALVGTEHSVGAGYDRTAEFEFVPVDRPWMIGEGSYRLYGSKTARLAGHGYAAIVNGACGTYPPTNFMELSSSDWTLLGEYDDSATFVSSSAYPRLMITWPVGNPFRFDAIQDEISGRQLSTAMEDENCGPSEVVSFRAYSNEDPLALAGPPDGNGFAGEADFAGFIALTFPDRDSAPEISPSTGQTAVHVQLAD